MHRRVLLFGLLGAVMPLLVGCLGAGPQEEGEPLNRGDVHDVAPRDERAWAPVDEADVRPGVEIMTPARNCPSNFLFIRPDNTSVFLGTTAACMRDVPVGSVVGVGAPDVIGILVYSSWETMAERGETDPHALEYNDFAVVKIDESSRHRVNPTMLHYGGPSGVADGNASGLGARVKSYTNLTANAGTRPQEAIVTGRAGDYALLVHGLPPTLPGTMGRGVLTEDGHALGVMVNLGVAPNAGANGVARLDTLMRYASDHAKLYMELVPGEPLPAPALVPVLGDLP